MEFEGIRIDHSREEMTEVENHGYTSFLLAYFRGAVLYHEFQMVEGPCISKGKCNKELVKRKNGVLPP